jgi:hypothetical protein
VDDALSRKNHLTTVSIQKLDLEKIFIDFLVENEHHIQVRDGSLQDKLENKYEGYQLNDYGLLIYKNSCIFPTIKS